MKASEIDVAAAQAGIDRMALCGAFQIVLPVLEKLAEKQGFVTRLFLGGFMGGIRTFIALRCGSA